MSIIPCQANEELERTIARYAEELKTQAHLIGSHGLSEEQFYRAGVFRGAVERLRGQFSAAMAEKRDFMKRVLNHMQDHGFIHDWESAGDANRHDYVVEMESGKIAAIELKGCLDGNNTNIFERPPQAQEFILWSVCTNPSADPRHNTWSGIHTRLSAEIISREQRVDGIVVWDMACGSPGRRCPKLEADPARMTVVGPVILPPPCIYVFPATVPASRNNPHPVAQNLAEVEILMALHRCFRGEASEISYVDFDVSYQGLDVVRTTRVRRNNVVVRESKPTPIRRA